MCRTQHAVGVLLGVPLWLLPNLLKYYSPSLRPPALIAFGMITVGGCLVSWGLANILVEVHSHLRLRERRIKTLPGTKLLQIVDFFFSPKAVEETFKPTVADWHLEYFEALNQKRSLKARWINVRYTYRFIMAMGLSKVFSVIKSVKSAFK